MDSELYGELPEWGFEEGFMIGMFRHVPTQFMILFVGVALLTGATFVDIQLGQNMYLRTGGDPQMEKVGKLTKGSIISIALPDDVVVYDSDKQINFSKSLKKWAQKKSEASEGPVHGTYQDDRQRRQSELFFPIRINEAAPGSKLMDDDRQAFMALEFLAQRGNALVLTRDQNLMAMKAKPLKAAQKLSTEECTRADCFFGKSAPVSPKNIDHAQTALHAAQVAEIGVASESFQAQPLTKSFPKQCQTFITPTGEYGPYGKMVLKEISRYSSYMSESNRISEICPAFNGFSEDQKKNFFVWIYAALAAKESTCDPNAQGESSSGEAAGLFQMEGDSYTRLKRDRKYKGTFCSGNIYDPAINIRCSARIMDELLNAGQGLYYTNKDFQYWGPFIVSGGLTKRLISQYSACSQ